MNLLLLVISIIISIYIDLSVIANKYSPVLIYWWIASIFILLLSTIRLCKKIFILPKISIRSALIFIIILLPAIIRILFSQPERSHGDELIAAYFSATEQFTKINFFGGIPTDKAQWVSQFPTMFFVLQKIFFIFFGESYMSIKFSIIPYVIIISIMLFLIVKRIFNTKTAVISLILYSFFAPSLYLETLGLHFISSTAVFMVFFYFILLYFRQNTRSLAILTGICCGFCYLFYNTSFIAFPIMMLIFFIQMMKLRKTSTLTNLVFAVIGFLIVMGPYIAYISKNGNYFISRMNQVSLLTGEWSRAKERIKKGEKVAVIIKENLVLSIKSLYQNGIGGHGGYNFGNLAFFDEYSRYFFLLGLLVGFVLLLRKIEVLFIIMVILISFFAGVVLSIPPPAYHRFSLAFPFITIIFSLPLYLILSLKKTNFTSRLILIFIFLAIYIINNQQKFIISIKTEQNNTAIKLASYLNHNFPERKIYIASFPGFAFEKVYYFSNRKNALSIQTRYHNDFLQTFNPNEKYVYVIFFPNDFNEKFNKLDPNGRTIPYSSDYSLFIN